MNYRFLPSQLKMVVGKLYEELRNHKDDITGMYTIDDYVSTILPIYVSYINAVNSNYDEKILKSMFEMLATLPIEPMMGSKDEWEYRYAGVYVNKIYNKLYKLVDEDGVETFDDTGRIKMVVTRRYPDRDNDRSLQFIFDKFIRDIINKLEPIKFPYTPIPITVNIDQLTIFDGGEEYIAFRVINYTISDNTVPINRYFKEHGRTIDEISNNEYNELTKKLRSMDK